MVANTEMALVPSLAGTRTKGRARGEGAPAHAEARIKGRRNVAEEFAAAGAAAFASKRSGVIGAKPMTGGFAYRIDTLHREAWRVLHVVSPRSRKAKTNRGAPDCRRRLK